MREDTLRCVLMIKAVEDADRSGSVLPPGDRAQATREALREAGATAGEDASRDASDAQLARALGNRAERLAGPLLERFPILGEALGRTRAPAWMAAALMVVAFASGIGLSALDGSRRINILAFPFIGLVAWNLAMYVLLAAAWARSVLRRNSGVTLRRRWAAGAFTRGLQPLLRAARRVHAVLGEALGSYAVDWADTGAPFVMRHAQRALHAAAATVALGLIAGLYVRGTVLRYDAGWESTFLGVAQVQAVIGAVFGPVAHWWGARLPDSEAELEALRWSGAGGGGDAAPWIHLIALTLLSYVVLPRLLLAGFATIGLWRLGRVAALPATLREYAVSVFRGSGLVRNAGVTSVTPYAYEPVDASFAALEQWLREQSGGDVRLERRTTLRYGEEDMAAPAFDLGAHRAADLHVVLMTLAATPEAENHGVVIAAARDAARRARPPAVVRIVVDEAPYVDRFSGDASLAPRLEERRRLWREFVASYGLAADFLGEIGDIPIFREAGK